MTVVTQMETILEGLMSGENELIKKAEWQISNGVENNTKEMANMLMQVIAVSNNVNCKNMAIILMRKKYAQTPKIFKQLDANFVAEVRKQVLRSLMIETDNKTRRHLGDFIVEIAKADPGAWQNLVPELVKACNEGGEAHVTRIFHVLIGLVDVWYPKNLNQNVLRSLINLSGQTFQSGGNDSQIAGLKLFGAVLVNLDNVQEYVPFIDSMFNCLANLVKSEKYEDCQTVLQVFVEICHKKAKFFRTKMDDFIVLMREIGITNTIEEDTRQLALESLITIVERDPPLVRKNRSYITSVVDVSLKMMLEVTDDQEDFNSCYDENVDDSPCFDSGQVALNRLAENINYKKFMPVVVPKLMELLQNNHWTCRHAALVAIAQTCELLHKSSADRDKMLETVIGYAAPQYHHRVRYATVHCIGIMCTDYGKKFVNKWHERILEVFMNSMQDVKNPRLQAHAAICVVNLAERVSSKLLRPNLEKLLRRLFDVLSSSKAKFVQENVLSAVCEVADNAEKEFKQYYPVFARPLLTILQNCTQQDQLDLRLEALRCLSYIGQAVGPELFAKDAKQAMEISVPLIKEGFDVLRIFNSWRRIFKTLKSEAIMFMQPVSEACMLYAQQQVKFENWQSDSDDAEVEINDREVPVNPSKVEEKVSAISLIDAMARYCDGAYTPMVEKTAGILLPLIEKPDDNAIQEAAAECLPGLSMAMLANFKKNKHPPIENQIKLFLAVLQKIVEQMPKEQNMTSLCAFALCIQKLMQIDEELTKHAMDKNAMMAVTKALLNCLNSSARRMDQRNVSMQEPGIDDEDIETLKEENESESVLSTHIADAIGAMIKVYKQQFLPLLSQSMDSFTHMLGKNGLDIQKRAALYIFCDVITHCDSSAFASMLPFLPTTFVECAQSQDDLVRQAGVYGCGLLISKIGNNFGLPLINVVKLCFAQFHEKRYSESEEADDVQDNAAMTIGRICKKCPNEVPVAQIYPEWLKTCFPIRADDDCSQWCYAEFLRLIEERNPHFVGKDGSGVGQAVGYMAESMYTHMSTEKVDNKFSALWKQIRTNQSMIALVKPELQKRINEMCK